MSGTGSNVGRGKQADSSKQSEKRTVSPTTPSTFPKIESDAMMDTGVLTIAAAMSTLSLTENFKNTIMSNKSMWANFGKKNSHMYRAELFTSMSTFQMSTEEKFVVMFLFCVIKSQPRVLKELDNMSEDFKNQAWYTKVREFTANKVTQYVTSANVNKKFPAVNIPSTLPGFDIMVYCLITDKKTRSIEAMSRRPTFAQLNLSPTMQAVAKEGYAYYWNEIVKGTKNTASVEEPKMREEYYANSEGDKYELFYVDSSNKLVVYPVDNPEIGYTKDEINEYLEEYI